MTDRTVPDSTVTVRVFVIELFLNVFTVVVSPLSKKEKSIGEKERKKEKKRLLSVHFNIEENQKLVTRRFVIVTK